MLTEIKTLLTTISNVYIGDMPATPDNCVCIYPTGGGTRGLVGDKTKQPTFMIKVRNTAYSTGFTQCESINTLLQSKVNGNFLLIAQEGDINGLGKDVSNRHEWSMNYRTYYK